MLGLDLTNDLLLKLFGSQRSFIFSDSIGGLFIFIFMIAACLLLINYYLNFLWFLFLLFVIGHIGSVCDIWLNHINLYRPFWGFGGDNAINDWGGGLVFILLEDYKIVITIPPFLVVVLQTSISSFLTGSLLTLHLNTLLLLIHRLFLFQGRWLRSWRFGS